MFGRTFLRAALVSTALAGVFAASPAAAQVAPPAPVRQSIDSNGVDLFLGTMNVSGPVLSAGGSGAQGLAWRKFNYGSGWGDNLVATLVDGGGAASVAFGTTTDHFSVLGSTYTSTEGDGATLSLSSGIYTYTAADGTVAHFTTSYVGTYPYTTVNGVITDLTRPDGEQLTYTFANQPYCSASRPGGGGQLCTQHKTAHRISSITSNSQYVLYFNYVSDTLEDDPDTVPTTAEFQDWYNNIGVSLTNNAISGASVRAQFFAPTVSGGTSSYLIGDAMGRGTSYRFGTGASVAGITLPGSSSEDVTVSYTSGKVASLTNRIGTTTYASSDAGGVRTVTVTNPAGKNTVYTFDIASQRMTSMTDATSRKTQWNYDTSGRLSTVTAPELNYTHYTYDGRGNVTQTDTVSKSGSSTLSTSANYDTTCTSPATCNLPHWTKDARGNQTDYTYDPTTGNVATVTAPAPTTGAVRPVRTNTYTTVNGESVLATSSVCRTTASCAGTSDELKTVMTYNANGLPASTTVKAGDNSLSATTTIGYDDVGNVTSVDGPLTGSDDTMTYRYDADRELVGKIGPDPDGSGGPLVRAAVRNTYDPRGIVSKTELGTVASTSDTDWAGFTSAQQVTATLDAAGRTTRVVTTAGGTTYGVTEYSFDSVGRPDCVAVRMNPTYWGTATGACTAETTGSDGPDRIARTTLYDDAGRPLTKTTAYGTGGAATETVSYTGNGRLATATDAESNKTTYLYDDFDRLKDTYYPVTTKGANTSNMGPPGDYEELTYDANGNVTNRRLRDTTAIGYTYDALNRLITKDLPGSELDVSYTYNLLGQPRTAATSAQTVTLGYDALGRLNSQATGTGTVGYTYDLAGRRTQMTWPDSFYVTYDYDNAGNLKTVKESGTTSLAAFAYDSLGRRTTLTRGNGVVTSYSYDNASRLTQLAANATGTSYDQTIGLGYNNAGQIRSRTSSNDAYAWTGSMDVTNAVTSNGLNQFTASGGTSLGYDTRGNMTSSGSDSYSYSSENLLTSATVASVTTALSYDPVDRLYQIGTSGGMQMVYDGSAIIGQSNGTTVGRRYVTVPGSDEVLSEYKVASGTKDYKLTDERGSVIATTDASGNGTSINTYDEYGIPGSNGGRFGYTGQFFVSEIGLQYSKGRMYSPRLGRFMQTDPIGYGDGLNWYNYVKSDPVNLSDPSGLATPVAPHPCNNGSLQIDCNGYGGDLHIVINGGGSDGGFHGVVQVVTVESNLAGQPPSGGAPGGDPQIPKCPTPPAPGPSRAGLNRGITTERIKAAVQGGAPLGLGSMVSALDFFNEVRPGGEADTKAYLIGSARFGNFGYGALGQARGFSLTTLLAAASAVQTYDNLRNQGKLTFGDNSDDPPDITAGYIYAAMGCELQ